jgi:type VI secretion system protein ImpL
MLRAAGAEFEVSLAASTAGQLLTALRDQITPVCQQTIANRYPFTRGSDREVPLLDFGRLFGPNQLLDKFFQQYLAPYADTSRTPWTWRQDTGVGSTLSANTLRDFQRAAEIRDAFFQTGGNMPGVTLAIRPPALSGATAKFEAGGTVVASAPAGIGAAPSPGSVSPVPVQWPGPTPHTAISVTSDGLGGQPSILEKNSPWSLFRVLEAGGLSVRGENATANYIVGGRELNYQISTGSVRNPLNLAILREFRCPSGI